MTLLADWLRDNKRTDGWLAERIGRERSVITKVKNGQIDPPASVVVRIQHVTDGQVTALDHVTAQQRSRAGVAA
jgi:predicted transcriptional regulator